MSKRKAAMCIVIAVAVSVKVATILFAAVETPKPRSRSEVEAILAKTPKPLALHKLHSLNVVLVAFKKDHGESEHDYPLWQKRWSLLLGCRKTGSTEKQVNLYDPAPRADQAEIFAGAPRVRVSTATGWPSKDQFKTATGNGTSRNSANSSSTLFAAAASLPSIRP